MNKKPLLSCTAIFLAQAAFSQASFSSGPTVIHGADNVRVTFAVTEAIDVEVAALDGQGKIVRHLAAGVLGGDTLPPAPLVSGLSQDLTWNLLDDAGNRLPDGDYSIRVRLGVRPEWKYRIDTEQFPGSHRSGQYAPLSTDNTVKLTNAIWGRISVESSNPDLYLRVNKAREEVCIRITNDPEIDQYVFDGNTGALIDTMDFPASAGLWQYWGEIAFSADGEIAYHTTAGGQILRYTNRGTPTLWPVTRKGAISNMLQYSTLTPGHAVGPDNNLYVIHRTWTRPAQFVNEYDSWQAGLVTKIDSTGVIADSSLVSIMAPFNCVRLDPQGNVYVGARVKPTGQRLPEDLDSLLPATTAPGSLRWWADDFYGMLFKFGPAGGEITFGDGPYESGNNLPQATPPVSIYPLVANGALWSWYGLNPIPTHYGERNSDAVRLPERGSNCCCQQQRFDIDGFGRVFIPDPFRLSLRALDNNSNPIFVFNHRDMPQAAVPMGWPHAIEATDKALYVADQVNDQVICFSLVADTTVTIPAPIAVESGRLVRGGGGFGLAGISPNPANPAARISYWIGPMQKGNVSLAVYDIRNRLVRELSSQEAASEGRFTVTWDGTDGAGNRAASGLYLCRLSVGKQSKAARLMLLK